MAVPMAVALSIAQPVTDTVPETAAFGAGISILTLGAASLTVNVTLARRVISRTPADRGQHADGVAPEVLVTKAITSEQKVAAHLDLWRNRAFVTLAGAMALSLFAQIGL